MVGVSELTQGLDLCGGQFFLDSSDYFGRVFTVSQAGVGYDETGTCFFPEFVHARCSSEKGSKGNSCVLLQKCHSKCTY